MYNYILKADSIKLKISKLLPIKHEEIKKESYMKNNSDSTIILLAEDDDGHAELICEYLKDTGLPNPIYRFKHGAEVWDFLHNKNSSLKFENGKKYLLITDIRMPKMNGIELLTRIKENQLLKRIPIIVYTTTDDQREIIECYQKGCSLYISKPLDYGAFAQVIKTIGEIIKIIEISEFR